MTELSTTSILSLFDTDKTGRELFVSRTVESVTSGHKSALDILLYSKNITSILEEVYKNEEFKTSLFNEASQNGKKFAYKNSEIQEQEAGTKYDYSQCGDPEYYKLSSELEALKEKVKKRETFLKSIPISGQNLLTEEGEVVVVFPPSKKSTTILKVTLK